MMDTRSREDMIASLPHGGTVAEIGVWTGTTGQTILTRNRPDRLFLIDCWEHQIDDYQNDRANVEDGEHAANYAAVLAMFAANRNVHVLRMYSIEAALMFRARFFDWLHFDADHSRLSDDIAAWWPTVKQGGWMTGHDYCANGDPSGVKAVVDDLAARLRLKLYVTQEAEYPSWAFQVP